MKKTLIAFAAIAASVFTLQSDDKKAAEDEIGAIFAKVPLHRIDGASFKEAKLEKKPEFYVLYYSASW